MSYFVLCTFDLKNANYQDYETAYKDLENIGLERVRVASNGNQIVIPTTTVVGEFNGSDTSAVRDSIQEDVQQMFSYRGFDSEIFVLASGNWAWGATTT